MFNVKQTLKDLESTIDELANRDWLQGRNFDRKGGCCAWGAVMIATHPVKENPVSLSSQIDRGADVARTFYRVHGLDVVSFNDAEGRTKDQVLQALRKALEALKADPAILTAGKGDPHA